MRGLTRCFLVPTLLVLVAGCAPAATSSSSPGQAAPPAAPKVLNLVGREGLIVDLPGQAGRTNLSGANFLHETLVAKDASETVVSRVAEAIAVDKGTWRLSSDGSMVTTWKLRPNVKWQDGRSFTAEDMMFTYMLYKDPELPSRWGEPLKLMTRAEMIDPLTFVVHWSEPYATANEAPALIPLPKHLLFDLYTNDKSGFGDTAFYHRDFVGLGAYKIVDWQPGAHVEFGRFADYYGGRPPLDARLVLTIEARETANIQRDVVREAFTDVALIPIYFQSTPLLVREGITGPESGTMINFYQWDKKS